MLFPSISDVILGKKTPSTDLVLYDGSLNGVKDYRDTFDLYLKGNVRFLETLYTDFYVANPKYEKFFDDLRQHRELIANSLPRRLMHSAAGMAKQKYKALSHPFPSKVEILAKYGYDPKQLHHLARLNIFMYKFIKTLSYESSLHMSVSERDYISSLKLHPLKVDEAYSLAREAIKNIDRIVDSGELPEDNGHERATEYLKSLTVDLFKARYDV